MSRGSPRALGTVVRRALRRLEVLAGGTDFKRFTLDADVLRGALALRAATVRGRALRQDALDRERCFEQTSVGYRAVRGGADDAAGRAQRICVDGVPWWVPISRPEDPAAVAHALAHQNFPYRAITQTRELAVGGIMLDVGANTGRMSIPRVMLGDVQLAYCAEPEPLNYACLVRNVDENGLRGLVMPDRVAIGSENTTVRLMRGKTSGGHRVINPGVQARRETLEVSSVTLDDWCERLGVDLQQVSFVKVDTQGSELHVLRGALRLLACAHVAWQIEIDVALLRRRGFAAADLFGMLQRHFTHWIDLNRHARGARVRAIEALPAALSYVQEGKGSRTDVLAFTLRPPAPHSPGA